MYSFPSFELVCCSMSGSNYRFLTCIQISQEAGKVFWYSHLLKNFPQFVVIHTVKGVSVVNEADVFSGILLIFPWSNECWQSNIWLLCFFLGFSGGSEVKASTCNVGDLGSIPGSGRCPGEGNGNPLQYSCLDNPMDGGAWWDTVHGVTKSWTQLSNLTFTFFLLPVIKT